MVTNFPRPIETAGESRSHGTAEGFGERVLDRVREVFCGFHGHDNLLQFRHDRMFLKCVSCGHESPGWEINDVPPVPAARPESRRHSAVRTQVADERRIA